MTRAPAASLPRSISLKHYLIAALALGAIGSLMTHSPLLVPLTLCAAIPIRSRMVRAKRRADEAAQRSAVVELCAALRGELQAGRQPSAAFAEAVWCRPELADLAHAVCTPVPQHSPADLLTAAAHAPGREGLASLAACWRAAEAHGVSLTGAVSGIEDGLRAEQSRRQNLATELAGTRSTIAILGVLPLLGLALGAALGADPIGTLLTRPAGEACLIIGCLLELIGFHWTDRLVISIESIPNSAIPTPFTPDSAVPTPFTSDSATSNVAIPSPFTSNSAISNPTIRIPTTSDSAAAPTPRFTRIPSQSPARGTP